MNKLKDNPTLTIHNLGPIHDCEMSISDFTILTGPQACGKSTIAKAIYFFKTVKDDVVAQFNYRPEEDELVTSAVNGLSKRLRRKFLGIFGSTYAMPSDMRIKYNYNAQTSISICLKNTRGTNFVFFDYSQNIKDILSEIRLDNIELYDQEQQKVIRDRVNQLFSDSRETIYIPAGRSMITLLTDSLNYIFSSMDDAQKRMIDYCTQAYVSLILKLKPLLTRGLEGLLDDKLHLTQDSIDLHQMNDLLELITKVLKGKYKYIAGEERLEISPDHYVKINFSSSGQQETIWVFNIIFYYLLNRRRTFLILEEPESHLYPESQQYMAEILGMFAHDGTGNQGLITTHSPYILGEFNNMLYASEMPESRQRQQIIKTNVLLPYDSTAAYHVDNGTINQGMQDHLIMNYLIDGASQSINDQNDRLMDLKWEKE